MEGDDPVFASLIKLKGKPQLILMRPEIRNCVPEQLSFWNQSIKIHAGTRVWNVFSTSINLVAVCCRVSGQEYSG